jgi:hypothetical protein
MDEVTQQNASLVEEAAAAAQSLQDQANNLTSLVAVFKMNGDAYAIPSPAKPVSRSPTKLPRARVESINAKRNQQVNTRPATGKPSSELTRIREATTGNAHWEEF